MTFGLRYPVSKHSDYVNHLGAALLFQRIPEMEAQNKRARRYRAVIVRERSKTVEFSALDYQDAQRRLAKKYGENAAKSLLEIQKD
jgi:hypothetical protein